MAILFFRRRELCFGCDDGGEIFYYIPVLVPEREKRKIGSSVLLCDVNERFFIMFKAAYRPQFTAVMFGWGHAAAIDWCFFLGVLRLNLHATSVSESGASNFFLSIST